MRTMSTLLTPPPPHMYCTVCSYPALVILKLPSRSPGGRGGPPETSNTHEAHDHASWPIDAAAAAVQTSFVQRSTSTTICAEGRRDGRKEGRKEGHSRSRFHRDTYSYSVVHHLGNVLCAADCSLRYLFRTPKLDRRFEDAQHFTIASSR